MWTHPTINRLTDRTYALACLLLFACFLYSPATLASPAENEEAECYTQIQRLAYGDQQLKLLQDRIESNLLSRVGSDELEAAHPHQYVPQLAAMDPSWMAKVMVHGGEFGPVQMQALRQEGLFLEVRDFLGRPIYYKRVLSGEQNATAIYQVVDRAKTPFAKGIEPQIVAPPRIGNMARPGDQTALANILSANQIGNSTSWEAGTGPQRSSMEAGLVKANRAMLEILASKEPLSAEAIDRWNYEIMTPRPDQGFGPGIAQALAGIRRGSPPVVHYSGGTKFVVDMQKAQMEVNAVGDYDVPVSRPENVETRLNNLLTEIRSINEKTPFIDVVRIYRRYMFTHPYLDGSGLTGRVLLDYCLIKAGFPPSPKFNYHLKLVAFTSDEQAAQNLAAAY